MLRQLLGHTLPKAFVGTHAEALPGMHPGCCPTTTPGTPVAAVVGAAASPTIPASKCGNLTYPFAKALVAANDSGNVPGKKTNTDMETAP